MTASTEFLDLPREVRDIVYTHLFTGSRLQIDLPRRLHGTGDDTPRRFHRIGDPGNLNLRSSLSEDACLPGVLLVNKLIRSEALPVFARLLTPEFHQYVPDYLREVPAHYLQLASSAILIGNENHLEPPLNGELPNLKRIDVFYTGSTNSLDADEDPDSDEPKEDYMFTHGGMCDCGGPVNEIVEDAISSACGSIGYNEGEPWHTA